MAGAVALERNLEAMREAVARIDPVTTPEMLTAKEVAALLNINIRTVWRYVSMGVIPPPAISVGRKFRRWKRADTPTSRKWAAGVERERQRPRHPPRQGTRLRAAYDF
jgi:hypothetical protein